MAYPKSLEQLVQAFERFPGVGRRTAERLAFHVLRDAKARLLAPAIEEAIAQTKTCSVCSNVADHDPCRICSDGERDTKTICVVEEPRDVEALERAGVFKGRYHVLMGALNPAEGTEESQLSVAALGARVRRERPTEVILATDPDAEGEATALLVLDTLERQAREDERAPPRVTRLARGLPAGSAIEYLHRGVLEDALEQRRTLRLKTPPA
ncbi:MAG TPA: recombination mediator RecR [Planctomycetota bacterium]|nr:recombination mediator RecR [Planctomycetota bacterium]